MTEHVLTVELTHREARALAGTANLLAEAMPREIIEATRRPDTPVPPLIAAAMKLEAALIGEGAER